MYIETAGTTEFDRKLAAPCLKCPTRRHSIYAALSGDMLDDLFRRGHCLALGRGETLMWEGEEALLVGTVRSGLLKITSMMSDGREQILGLAFPGDFVGRPFSRQATSSITALTDTTMCVFRGNVFDAFAGNHPELQHAVLLHALDELDRARRWMMLLARTSARERVASFLIEMADRAGAGDGEPVDIMLSRQQMADFLGLTIETVSRRLTALRQARVVRLPDLRSFIILSRAALRDAAGDALSLAA